MKKLITLFALFLGLGIANAQEIVMGNYKVFDQKNYVTSSLPEKEIKDIVNGFSVDYKFSAAMASSGTAAVVLNEYEINYSKGFFKKFGSEKTGKYYACSVLKGLCNEAKYLQALWIEINWEYQGENYKSGGQMQIHKSQYVNSFSPPSEIGYQAVRDGKAKITSITVKSYTIEKTDPINQLIYDLKSKE